MSTSKLRILSSEKYLATRIDFLNLQTCSPYFIRKNKIKIHTYLKNYKSSFKFKNSRVARWKRPDLLNLFIVIHTKNQYMYNALPYQYQLLQAIQTHTTYSWNIKWQKCARMGTLLSGGSFGCTTIFTSIWQNFFLSNWTLLN